MRYCQEARSPWGDLPGEGSPLVFVHGHHSVAAGLRPLALFLQTHTGRPSWAMSWTDHRSPLEDHALRMSQQLLERLDRLENSPPITLIAHSRGGLVAALFCARWAQQHHIQIKELITLGTPWWGTKWAAVGQKIGYPGSAPLELARESDLLATLRAWATSKESPRICCIASPNDQLILPASAALLPEKEHLVLSGTGHVGLLFDERAMHQVLSWVRASDSLAAPRVPLL